MNRLIKTAKSVAICIIPFFLICFILEAGTQAVSNDDYDVLISPHSIDPGQTFRVLVASDKPDSQATLRRNEKDEFEVICRQSYTVAKHDTVI